MYVLKTPTLMSIDTGLEVSNCLFLPKAAQPSAILSFMLVVCGRQFVGEEVCYLFNWFVMNGGVVCFCQLSCIIPPMLRLLDRNKKDTSQYINIKSPCALQKTKCFIHAYTQTHPHVYYTRRNRRVCCDFVLKPQILGMSGLYQELSETRWGRSKTCTRTRPLLLRHTIVIRLDQRHYYFSSSPQGCTSINVFFTRRSDMLASLLLKLLSSLLSALLLILLFFVHQK